MSLYDEIGGEEALRRVLCALYDKLFDDAIVGFLFAGKDKAKLVESQLWFTARFLGGPSRYTGMSIPDAHAKLPLLAGHFDRRHLLLRQTLEEQKVPDAVRAEWLRVDRQLKYAVLASAEEARLRARLPEDPEDDDFSR